MRHGGYILGPVPAAIHDEHAGDIIFHRARDRTVIGLKHVKYPIDTSTNVNQLEHTVNASISAQRRAAEFWYALSPCNDHIVHLREAWIDPYLTGDIWLVRGRDRDLLVDCGTGIVSPRPVVDAVARNPVIAVACNRWYDHAGGLGEFTERGCHRDDAALIAAPTADSSVASIYVSDEMLMALPFEGYTTENYRMAGAAPTILFDDGDVIDLGNRAIEVLHVPGMTPGSVVLWEKASGSLFTSDTLFDDPTPELRAKYRQPPDAADPRVLAQRIANLERIGELPVTTVYAGHFGRIGRRRMLDLIRAALMSYERHRTEFTAAIT
jgi:glyoxylase-like metal-dependent hydrolase (beta-lactamase superfamily II)